MAKNKVDSVLILLSFHSVEGMDKKEFQIEVVIGRKQGEVRESRVRESNFREGGQREVFWEGDTQTMKTNHEKIWTKTAQARETPVQKP